MEVRVHLLGAGGVHGFCVGELLQAGVADAFHGFEGAQECLPSGGTDAGDLLQHGMGLGLASQIPVEFDGEAVRLVLDPGDQLEAFGMGVDGQFFVVEVEASGAVEVVFYHAANGNIQVKAVQHLQGDVYLPSASVHHQKVRKTAEAAQVGVFSLFLQFLSLFQAVGEPPGKNFLHACVVVGAFDGADLEFPVIVAFRLSVLVHDHGANRLEPADVGDIIGLHANDPLPVQDLFQQLIDAGLVSKQKFTADPRPMDPAVPKTLIDDLVFKKFMYSEQESFEKQLVELGLKDDDSYTCTSYLDQVGNKPKKGDVLSWAESSAVVYANSVLGARCNRNSGIIELMGSIAGFVPEFGFLTDEGRKADWIVELKCSKKPDAQLLGSAIGMKVMEEVMSG